MKNLCPMLVLTVWLNGGVVPEYVVTFSVFFLVVGASSCMVYLYLHSSSAFQYGGRLSQGCFVRAKRVHFSETVRRNQHGG